MEHNGYWLDTLNALTVGLAAFDHGGDLLHCNLALRQLCPVLSETLACGTGADRLRSALDDQQLSECDRAVLEWLATERRPIIKLQNSRNGRWLEFRRQITAHGWVLSVTDVDRTVQTEAELRASQESFRNVVLENQMGILIVDREGVVLLSNTKAQTVLGKGNRELDHEYLGLPLVAGQKTEIDIARPDRGGVGVAEMSVTETLWEGRPVFLVTLHDITERKRAEERITHIAYHDPLTNLPNRRLFIDRLQHALTRASREADSLAVAYLDLDGFKAVNDTLGHSGGDQLLCQAADRLHACLRQTDTLARLGGDEFAVLMEHVAGGAAVHEVAERLRGALTKPFTIAGHRASVSTSIGVSLYPDHATTADELIRYADAAMYLAKQTGKNRAMFFHPQLNAAATAPRYTQDDFRRALRLKQFAMVYQPQVDLGDGRLVGLEALLRWRHPDDGLLTPNVFIADLEDSGMLEPVTEWTIRHVCRQVDSWRRRGLAPPPVAINLAVSCMDSESVRNTLCQALHAAALAPGRIELEIAEHALREDIETVSARIGRLNALGVRVAIDNYGGDQSALSALWQTPIQKVKLDAALTRWAATDQRGANVLATLVALAKSLDLDVVATGVETAEQKQRLLELGCPFAQGWLDSQALPAAAVAKRLTGSAADCRCAAG